MKQIILMTLLAAAIVAATLWLSPVLAQTTDPLLVFDETIILDESSPTRSDYVSLSTESPHEGMNCLRSEQDPWHVPRVRMGLNDVSGYAGLEFWVRSAAEAQTIYVQVAGYQIAGAVVPVTATNQWSLIQIPIANLASDNDALTRAWDIYFDGKQADGSLSTFWLDDIRFVTTLSTTPPPDPEPDPEPDPTPEPEVTWSAWHFAGIEIIEERTSSDGQTQRRSSPLILKLEMPTVETEP